MSSIHSNYIASGNQSINKLNVPIYNYLMLALVTMKVGMCVHGNVTNTP